jgi:hypothetical protein
MDRCEELIELQEHREKAWESLQNLKASVEFATAELRIADKQVSTFMLDCGLNLKEFHELWDACVQIRKDRAHNYCSKPSGWCGRD